MNFWSRDRESFLTSDETDSIDLVREFRIITAHFLRVQNLGGIPGTIEGLIDNALIYSTMKKVIIYYNLINEIMSKVLKKTFCKNGDNGSNEFKIGPQIS